MDISKSNIGLGFSTGNKKLTYLRCVKTEETEVSFDSSAGMSFSNKGVDSFAEGMHLWDISGSVAVLIPRLTVGIWVRSMSYSQDSRYSKHFVYSHKSNLATVTMKQTEYGYDMLNDAGKGIYSSDYKKFHHACGDKYVTQQVLGTKLNIGITFSARTMQDKRELDLAIHGKLDFFIVVAKLTLGVGLYTKEKSISYDVRISALQIGGDVTGLAAILKEENGEYTISCNSKQLGTCVSALERLIEYSKNDYIEQIDVKDHDGLLRKASVIDTVYMDYKNMGLNYDLDIKALESAKGKLSDIYYKMIRDKEFIEHILHKEGREGEDINQDISKYKKFDLDLIQFIDKIDVTGLARDLSNNYWKWDGTMLFIREKLTFERILENIDKWKVDVETASEECHFNTDKCDRFAEELQGSNLWKDYNWEVDIFAKAYQMIVVCKDKAYPKYLLPVSKNSAGSIVYQENSRHDVGSGESSYHSTLYTIQEKELLVLDNFLAENYNCGQMIEGTDTISNEFYGRVHDEGCIKAICPNQPEDAYVLLNSVENPI